MEQITEYVYPTVSEYGKFVIQYKLKLPALRLFSALATP